MLYVSDGGEHVRAQLCEAHRSRPVSADRQWPAEIAFEPQDFFRTQLAGWRPAMIAHAILARQVTTVTRGKDTVDHAIVADAITLALTTDVTTVVIASSDSDFVDLALQLREIGCVVHGYGERKTSSAMVAACDRFVYLEDLPTRSAVTPASGAAVAGKSAAKVTAKSKAAPVKAAKSGEASDGWAASVREVVAALSNGGNGAELPKVCLRMHAQGITARLPEKARAKPGRFLATCGLFEVVKVKGQDGRSTHTYLRNKPHALFAEPRRRVRQPGPAPARLLRCRWLGLARMRGGGGGLAGWGGCGGAFACLPPSWDRLLRGGLACRRGFGQVADRSVSRLVECTFGESGFQRRRAGGTDGGHVRRIEAGELVAIGKEFPVGVRERFDRREFRVRFGAHQILELSVFRCRCGHPTNVRPDGL